MIASSFIALASLQAYAAPVQYREIKLADGREFIAQVVETRPEGMWIRLPQGERLVPFTVLEGMKPSDEGAYLAQPAWPVAVVTSPALFADVTSSLKYIQGLNVWTVGMGWPASDVGIDQQARAAVCGRDLDCLLDALGGDTGRWVIVVEEDGNGTRIESAWTGSGTRLEHDLNTAGQAALWSGLMTAMELDGTASPPKSLGAPPRAAQRQAPAAPKEAKEPKEPRVAAPAAHDRYVPLPGYVAMKRNDKQGLARALAITLPATAVWVAATGAHAQSPGTHAALGFVGFGTLAITSNHLFGYAKDEGRASTVALD